MTTGSNRAKSRKKPRREGTRKAIGLSIREISEQKDGYTWTTFLVQGWQENGRWQRKRFRERTEADAFVALKQVELLNHGTRLREVVTTLSPSEVKEAEAALNRLKEIESATSSERQHTLLAAIEFYAKHHDKGILNPVPLSDARRLFLDAKQKEGVRSRSLIQLNATLRQFENAMDNCAVCEVSTPDVDAYLNGLRSKDGKHKASPKTFNNYRADLHVFFRWCGDQVANDDSARKVRWLTENPVAAIKKKKAIERDLPETLDVEEARALLRYVESYEGSKSQPKGSMAPYFAVALFAGLRTGEGGELHKLALHPERSKLLDLDRGVIHIKPEISKTGQYRQVLIRPVLRAWLERYGVELLPANSVRHIKAIRKKFNLGHDVLRHTFFSMHVAAFKSVGEAALEGGNTEQILKKHYLNLATYQQGAEFWKLIPWAKNKRDRGKPL